MNYKELAELVPWLVEEKLASASSPKPTLLSSAEAPSWSFRTGPALAVAAIFPEANELRVTVGLAIDIPYRPEVTHYVNSLNTTQLVFGRAFLVGNDESGRGAVLAQEIVFGESVSWDFPPSIQNLLRIIATLCGQAARLGPELFSRYGTRPMTDDEAPFLLIYD